MTPGLGLTGYPIRRNAAPEVLTETLDYIERVLADGGTIGNPAFVNFAYQHAKDFGYLSSVEGWWSALAGVKVEAGGVSKLYDLSANNRDLTQDVENQRPNLVGNAIVFGAREDNIRLILGPSGVLRNVSGATLFVRHAPSASAPRPTALYIATPSGGNSVRALLGLDNGAFRAGGRRLDIDTAQFIVAGGVVLGTTMTQTGVFDFANAKAYLYVDGTLLGSADPFQTAGSTSNTDSGLTVLGQVATVPETRWKGSIFESLILASAVDDDLREAIEARLASEYPA